MDRVSTSDCAIGAGLDKKIGHEDGDLHTPGVYRAHTAHAQHTHTGHTQHTHMAYTTQTFTPLQLPVCTPLSHTSLLSRDVWFTVCVHLVADVCTYPGPLMPPAQSFEAFKEVMLARRGQWERTVAWHKYMSCPRGFRSWKAAAADAIGYSYPTELTPAPPFCLHAHRDCVCLGWVVCVCLNACVSW